MADTKISALTALTGANSAPGDLLDIVDVSDTSMAATGTNKKITREELQTFGLGTITTDKKVQDLSVTWNNAAVTFTGLKFNVTDTASAAASLLMDLQVGGTSKFKVDKAGAALVSGNGSASAPMFGNGNTGLFFPSSALSFAFGGSDYATMSNGGMRMSSTLHIGWASGVSGSNVHDLALFRDAANTLAQRNSTNAQTFNIYNTYTDASNYERGFMKWNSNVLEVGTEAAGTGTWRGVRIVTTGWFEVQSYSQTVRLKSGTNYAGISLVADTILGIHDGTYGVYGALQFGERTAPAAPATDNVRIYAEDNGSGKTRLMALFATGAAQQVAIEP